MKGEGTGWAGAPCGSGWVQLCPCGAVVPGLFLAPWAPPSARPGCSSLLCKMRKMGKTQIRPDGGEIKMVLH